MISTITPDANNQLSVSSERTFPAAIFPRKHILSVFNDRQDALQAVKALYEAGYQARDIHVLTNSDYVEAIERGHTLISALASTDLNAYLDVTRQGSTILAVRLWNYGRITQVRDLLAPHHAHIVNYIDTWTVAQLLP